MDYTPSSSGALSFRPVYATTVQSVEVAIDTSKQSGFYRIVTAE